MGADWEKLAQWKPLPVRWWRRPLCALRSHPMDEGAYCSCRAVIYYPIIKG